ncbi:MAG: signal peptide peptidase SppA [Candidatus Aminicenantes bacterium]|nr:signal peptide peptidase SppA [Candidatus Aminicenantes bacterium]
MKKRAYVWILVLFFVFLIAAAGVSLLFLSFERAPDVPSAAYLRLDLAGAVVDFPETGFWSSFLPGGRPLSIHDVWMGLRKAAADSRIRGVFVKIGMLECDWAKCAEIRDALIAFRRSGKKAVAFIEELPEGDKEYFLATGCDRIVIHPLGWLGINGLGGYVPFFKKTLDKLGIRAEFEHIEEFKTAYNQFTESGFTSAHREMTASLLQSRFEDYVAAVAAARDKSPEEVRALIDRAFFQGEQAKEAGLVDEVLYEDQAVAPWTGDGRPARPVPLSAYSRIDAASLGLNKGRRIALIYGQGTILSGPGYIQTMGSDTVAEWFRAVREDASILAVVFRIDSPGGSAVASDTIWREVELTRKKKPVVVSMSDLAGSGGYWIAMSADRIIAHPQTLTGSIGVISGKFDLSGLMDKIGVTTEKIAIGKQSDIFTPFRPMSPAERDLFKKQIRWIYDRFIAQAAEGRKMKPEDVDQIGRGRVWTGRQALEIGLVDELGGLPQAVEAAKSLAGIEAGEDVRLVVWPKRTSFFASLFGRAEAEAVRVRDGLLPREVKNALERALRLNKERVWALMPFLPE